MHSIRTAVTHVTFTGAVHTHPVIDVGVTDNVTHFLVKLQTDYKQTNRLTDRHTDKHKPGRWVTLQLFFGEV